MDQRCSFFCFFADNKPSYGLEELNGLVVTKNRLSVYILNRLKQEEGSWNCFDPFLPADKTQVDITEFLNSFEFCQGILAPCKSVSGSLGPVAQVDVICLDLSGSMTNPAFHDKGR